MATRRATRTSSVSRACCLTCLALIVLATVLVDTPLMALQSDGQADAGARIFPESTSVYLRVNQPGELIDKIMKHPLRAEIEALEPVQEALNTPEMKNGRIALALLESQIGEEWLPAVKRLTSGGLFVGADLGNEAVGIAFQADDEELLKKTAGVLLGFVKNNAGEDAFEVKEYRGGKFAEFDDFLIARFGTWFIVANKNEFAKQMADNLLDGVMGDEATDDILLGNPVYASSATSQSTADDAWAFVNLKTIRDAGVAGELFAGTTENPGNELLFGGILEAIEGADFASAALQFNEQAISLKTLLPFDAKSFREAREFFFGNQSLGRAPSPLEIPDLLGQIVAYRDLGSWWLSKEDLFPENVIAQLAQGDSQLSTVFGGVDFGQDVLGALQPGLRVLVKGQEYREEIKPDIEIPAFALMGRLQNPDDARRFRVSFQSLIGFLNIDSGQQGRPLFEIMTTKENGIQVTGGEYMLEDDSMKGLMLYNFSPAIAFQDDYMIISSTTEFARELAEASKQLVDDTHASESNTLMTMNAAAIKHQLQVNRDALVAQSMVDRGLSRQQAATEVDLILGLIDYLDDARLDFRVEPEHMVLDIQVRFQASN
ncbi:MAG: hypothetical protein ACR2NP_16605 [Pirellulaceae bacterium]